MNEEEIDDNDGTAEEAKDPARVEVAVCCGDCRGDILCCCC
jgi:hypothetical protein